MKHLLITMLICCLAGKAWAQYNGGADDGFSNSISLNQNALASIYNGGQDDGFANISVPNQNALSDIFHGGQDDGFSNISVFNQNPLGDIFHGGQDDGFSNLSVANQNALNSIFHGGPDDGFSNISVLNQNALNDIFHGGQDDGFSNISVLSQNALANIFHGGGNDGFSSISVPGLNPGALPVTIISFDGRWQDEDALLSWATSSEHDLDRFELERSIDGGTSFELIGSIDPKGGPFTEASYTYVDFGAARLAASTWLYRLKSVSQDGSAVYSAIVRLTRNSTDPAIILYPNPNTGRFTLQILGNADIHAYSYELISASGAVIRSSTISDAITQIDAGPVAAGTYLFRLSESGRPVQTFTIIITP